MTLSARSNLQSLIPWLRNSQVAWGLACGLAILGGFYLWENWSRAPLAAMAMGAALVLGTMFKYPVIGVMGAAFLAASNLSIYIPGSMSGILLLTFAILGIKKLINHDVSWSISSFTIWALLFATWFQVSGLWADTYLHYDWGNFYRIVLIVLVISEAVKTKWQLIWVIVGFAIGVCVTGVTTIQSAAEFYISGAANELSSKVATIESSRFFGNWEEPNAMALAVVPLIGLMIAVFRTRLSLPLRLLMIIATLLGFVAVVLSLSRGGMICLTVLLLLVLSVDKYRVWLAGVAAALVTAIIMIFPTDVVGRIESLAKLGDDGSISQRSQLLQAGFKIIEESFPLGVGLGNFRTYSIDYANELPHGMIAHNAFIDVTSETGMVGLVLLLGVLASLFKSLQWKRRRLVGNNFGSNINVCLGGALVAICLAMMFLSAAGYAVFWMVMALISVYPNVFPEAASE